MAIAYLSLGSNIGDRLSNIQQAVQLLSLDENMVILKTSSFYETEPWGVKNQPWFVNAVIRIETELKPIELLRVINHTEERLGRCRELENRWCARTLDIDILFYDDLIFENEILTIPHKNLHNRAFVLVPMLEIAENYIHPVFKKTILEIYDELNNPEEIFLYGTIKGDR